MVRLVNKSNSDCYTNYADGRSLFLRPGAYVVLKTLSESDKSYYLKLRSVGLVLEGYEEVVKKVEEPEVPEESTSLSREGGVDSLPNKEEPAEEPLPVKEVEKLPIDSLMKRTKSELLRIAKEFGIEGVEELSKRQIAERIVSSYGE